MRKYSYALLIGISLTAIGLGGYSLYQQQQLGARVSRLEKKVEELARFSSGKTDGIEKKEKPATLYQRLQFLDDKVGEWIKNH